MLLSKEPHSVADSAMLRVLQDVENNVPTSISTISQLNTQQFWALIEYRTPVDAQSILHLAATNQNFGAIQGILSLPWLQDRDRLVALVNAQNRAQETVLHQILGDESTNSKLALLLLQAGANPWILNSNKETAFYLASYKGLLEVVEHMLFSASKQQPLDPSLMNATTADGSAPLSVALARGHTAVVDAIRAFMLRTTEFRPDQLDNIANALESSERTYPLHDICRRGDIEQLRRLPASMISKVCVMNTNLSVLSYFFT